MVRGGNHSPPPLDRVAYNFQQRSQPVPPRMDHTYYYVRSIMYEDGLGQIMPGAQKPPPVLTGVNSDAEKTNIASLKSEFERLNTFFS